MASARGDALDWALALARAPGERFALRQQPLPGGMDAVLQVAGGSNSVAIADAAARAGMAPTDVVEAARFYLREVLFFPDADAYRVLGLASDATDGQIKHHHRLLQQWLHPDRPSSDWDAAFAARVNAAWAQVRTSARREAAAVRVDPVAPGAASEPAWIQPTRTHAAVVATEATEAGFDQDRWRRRAPVLALFGVCAVLGVLAVRDMQREPEGGLNAAVAEAEMAETPAVALQLPDARPAPRAVSPAPPAKRAEAREVASVSKPPVKPVAVAPKPAAPRPVAVVPKPVAKPTALAIMPKPVLKPVVGAPKSAAKPMPVAVAPKPVAKTVVVAPKPAARPMALAVVPKPVAKPVVVAPKSAGKPMPVAVAPKPVAKAVVMAPKPAARSMAVAVVPKPVAKPAPKPAAKPMAVAVAPKAIGKPVVVAPKLAAKPMVVAVAPKPVAKPAGVVPKSPAKPETVAAVPPKPIAKPAAVAPKPEAKPMAVAVASVPKPVGKPGVVEPKPTAKPIAIAEVAKPTAGAVSAPSLAATAALPAASSPQQVVQAQQTGQRLLAFVAGRGGGMPPIWANYAAQIQASRAREALQGNGRVVVGQPDWRVGGNAAAMHANLTPGNGDSRRLRVDLIWREQRWLVSALALEQGQ